MKKRSQPNNGKLTVKDAIVAVLEEFKRPMHYSEITRHARPRTSGLVGRTPEQTVNATMITNPDMFVRVARGVYALSQWSIEQQAKVSAPTRLERFLAWGFRSYSTIASGEGLPMTPLSVLIGPNSSGKSNLLDLILLISEAANQKLADGIARRNGMRSVLWQNGAQEFGWDITIPPEGAFASDEFPVKYRVQVQRRGEAPVIANEEVAVVEGTKRRVILSARMGVARFEGSNSTKLGPDKPLESDAELAIAQIRDPQTYPTLSRLREYLSSWAVYREFLTDEQSKMRQAQAASSETQLQPHGENLITVLHQISNRSQYRPYYDAIRDVIGLAFQDFEQLYFPAEPGASGKIGLAWKDRTLQGDLDVTQLSDGMLRFLALATLLTAPDPPPLICIDEPEIGLHPALLHLVVAMLEKASARTQIVVTTHSAQLVSGLSRADSVTIVERHDGTTTLRRLDGANLANWLDDFSLGELWLQGEIGGRP